MRIRNSSGRMDRVFGALADPTRRAILERLMAGEAGATELARPFAMSQPAVSRHLRVLREAGLIEKRVHGRNHWCVLRGEAIGDAAAWLERYRGFWEGRLDALAGMFGGVEPSRTKRVRAKRRSRR